MQTRRFYTDEPVRAAQVPAESHRVPVLAGRVIEVASRSGPGIYPVYWNGFTWVCPCKGYHYNGKCWHSGEARRLAQEAHGPQD